MSDETDVYPNTLDWRSNRCGHNYPAAECKEKHCLARDLIIIRAELKAENERLRAELRERCDLLANMEYAYCPECGSKSGSECAKLCDLGRLRNMPEEPTPAPAVDIAAQYAELVDALCSKAWGGRTDHARVVDLARRMRERESSVVAHELHTERLYISPQSNGENILDSSCGRRVASWLPSGFQRFFLAIRPDGSQRKLVSLTAYIDESGTHAGAPLITTAGYLADSTQWDGFQREWAGLIYDLSGTIGAPLDYIHMTDFTGSYKQYKPLRSTPDIKAQFQERVYSIIKRHVALGAGVAFAVDDYEAVRQSRKSPPPLSAYAFALQVTTIMMGIFGRNCELSGPIIYVLERGDQNQHEADQLLSSYRDVRGLSDLILYDDHYFADKRKNLPLQAADALAYESNRFLRHALRFEQRASPHWKVHPAQWMQKGFVYYLKRQAIQDILDTLPDGDESDLSTYLQRVSQSVTQSLLKSVGDILC